MTSGKQATSEQALTREIEQTREQLGDTVERLAAKADVKSLARAKAAELAGRVKVAATVARQRPLGAVAAAAAAVAIGALVIWRRRR